jgi:hydrophobic/amphiphilic exporter-1 (mainly G- bacteria), HAE1 family
MTRGPSFWLLRTRKTGLLLWLASLVALGVWSCLRIPLEWVPSLESPRVGIEALWPGASARAVETEVTTRLEQALQDIASVKSLESQTAEGTAVVQSELMENRSIGVLRFEMLDRLAALSRRLPEGVSLNLIASTPEAFRDDLGFMTLQLVAPLAPAALRELAERDIAPRFFKLPGVAGGEIAGGEQRELLARVAPERLDIHRQPVVALREKLAGILHGRSYGTLPVAAGQVLLYRQGERALSSLAELPLATAPGAQPTALRLNDLCRVELGVAPLRSVSRINGKPVVSLMLERSPGSHLLRVARDVNRVVAETRKALPPGAELLVADDRSESIREQFRDLALRGGLGLLLVVLTLAAILRSRRAVMLVLLVAILSLAAAMILFQILGITLNVLTIAGLVLLFGLLADNAIIVTERLQVELAARSDGGLSGYAAAAGRAVRAVWLPLVGGTLTTCAVFLPMVYLSGELRKLFASFAVLCSLTLVLSLVASVFIVPNLGQGLRSRRVRKAAPSHARWLLFPYRFNLRLPKLSLLLLALAIGLPTPLLPDLIEEPEEGWPSEESRHFAERYNATFGSERFRTARVWLDPLLGGVTRPFLQKVELGKRWDFNERPEIRVRLQLPAGTGIQRTDERIRLFEQEALASPAVERTLVNVRERTATLRVLFRDKATDTDEPYLLRERLIAHALQMAGLEISISGLLPTGFYNGLGEVSGLTVHAFGAGYEGLEEAAQGFARRLASYPRVAGVDVNAAERGQAPAREVVRFHWGPEAGAQTGLSARALAAALQPRLWREAPDFYTDFEGAPRMPVRVVMEGAEDVDLEALLGTPLAADTGGPVRLADHAELSFDKDPPVIERFDQQYRRTLRVFFRGPYEMGRKMLDREIASMRLPPGYRLERPKSEFFTAEVQKEFLWLVLGTIALVFLVIAAVLESWRLAAVAMLAVPLAWIGIALGFLLTGQNFAEGAFIGVLLTVGIVVNDSILLTDRYRRLRQARPGSPVPRLALLALRQRLRPMWATTLTSIAGLLPLLVLPKAGNFWVGLAVTVVGGLLASTLLAPMAVFATLSSAAARKPRTFAAQPSLRPTWARVE